jgi:diketogulonate reductase-like aldo/keto reductase
MSGIVTKIASVPSPKIIYGTAWKKDDTERLVRTAIQYGFRGIDTACQPKHYNEAGVGAGVAACLHSGLTRADLYLQTKFTSVSGQDPAQTPYDRNARISEQVAQSFAASLRNLQTDYLDCLVLHSPLATMRETVVVWRAIEQLVDTGGVKAIGISNCYRPEQIATLYELARIKPAVVQNRFYAETHYDREIRDFCHKHNIIYQSFWTLTANPKLLTHAAIKTLASKYSRTAAQILYRYLTQIDIVPLTGTRSEVHMRDDLAIFEFELDKSERKVLAAIF